MQRSRKLRIGLLALVLLIPVLLGISYLKKDKQVLETIPVVLYSDSAQNYALHGEKSILHIEGSVEKKWFLPDVFEGLLWIDGMEQMKHAIRIEKGFQIKENAMEYLYQDGTKRKKCWYFISCQMKEMKKLLMAF